MSSRRVVQLICDGCGSSGQDVETVVFGPYDGEACTLCHERLVDEAVQHFMKNARTNGAAPPRRAKDRQRQLASSVGDMEVMRWPDTPWRFTAHALQRMGERHVLMEDLLAVLKKPELTRPGEKKDGVEVWEGGSVKVVLHPDQKAILTVAHRFGDG